MNLTPLLLQFGVSLIAILALVALARAMRLGGNAVLQDDAAVQTAANEVEDGFRSVRVSITRDKTAALAKDADGRIMLIKRHGNQFAGRVLTKTASVREEVDGLVVESGEARFGAVRLTLNDAASWADAINRL
ncbi:MAG: hypothetical protein ABJN35_13550 [Erythrobacter sp.]